MIDMKINCPECRSENLDQGLNGKILCHDCNRFWILVKPEIVGV